MFFRQFINEDLGCASYLIADAGHAVVVDPSWDTRRYLAIAQRHGLSIDHVLETHTHADHVSGRGRLHAATGAKVHLPAGAIAVHAFTPLDAGSSIRIGRVVIETLATPGHRPEHVSFLVTDTSRSETPQVLLTGDSLLVGDVARPDLAVEGRRAVADAARELLSSVNALATLPDHVEVWPGHIGGSLCCGGETTEKPSSTIGIERRTNAGLALTDPGSFVTMLCERLPARPPTADDVVDLNQGPLLSASEPLVTLEAAQVAKLQEHGAAIVDGRTAHSFDAASIPGSLCIPLESGGVGSRAAWLLPSDSQIVVVADSRADVEDLARRLATVGLRNIVGGLANVIRAWRFAGLPLASTERIDVGAASRMLAAKKAVLVDVRDEDEWRANRIPSAVHIPWREIPQRRVEVANIDKPMIVACASGRRTATAASALRTPGSAPVLRIDDGGIADIQKRLQSTERGARFAPESDGDRLGV